MVNYCTHHLLMTALRTDCLHVRTGVSDPTLFQKYTTPTTIPYWLRNIGKYMGCSSSRRQSCPYHCQFQSNLCDGVAHCSVKSTGFLWPSVDQPVRAVQLRHLQQSVDGAGLLAAQLPTVPEVRFSAQPRSAGRTIFALTLCMTAGVCRQSTPPRGRALHSGADSWYRSNRRRNRQPAARRLLGLV